MGRNTVSKRAKPVEFISHHPTLIQGMKFSSQEFYSRVEKALAVREIPNIRVSRVDWKEGGPLSARREYLRIQRERFIFDVCAAPFGTGFFVSVWCAEKPLRIGLLMWLLLITVFGGMTAFLFLDGFDVQFMLRRNLNLNFEGASILFIVLLSTPFLAALLIVGSNLDLFMIGVPVVGYIYEKYFRAYTYYRTDMMCMYRTAVHTAVSQTVDEITKAQGISPMSGFEQGSITRGLQNQVANGRD